MRRQARTPIPPTLKAARSRGAELRDPHPTLLRDPEIAAMLDVSPSTVRKIRREGLRVGDQVLRLEVIRIGTKSTRTTRSSVETLIAAMRAVASAQNSAA